MCEFVYTVLYCAVHLSNKEKMCCIFALVFPYAIASINPKLIRFLKKKERENTSQQQQQKTWPYQVKPNVDFTQNF